MSMNLKTYGQLRKLMMLTHSDNDTEALAALRKANALMREHSYDWNSAFDRLVKVESPVEMADFEVELTTSEMTCLAKRTLRNGIDARLTDSEVARFAKRAAKDETLRIENAFTTIEEQDPRGSFADFIASLKNQWDRVGRLTSAQKDALFKAADV